MKKIFIVFCVFLISNSFTTLQEFKAPKSICIKGKIDNQGGVDNFDNLYISILWQGSDDDKSVQPVYFDKSIKVKEDGTFKYKTNAKIPQHATFAFKEIDFKMSIGLIFVYEDKNGDKKGELDEVVGVSSQHMLSYLEGNINDFAALIKKTYKKDLETLLLLKEGFQLNKVVRTKGTFDDLQPDKKNRKNIEVIIPKNKNKVRSLIPNWT